MKRKTNVSTFIENCKISVTCLKREKPNHLRKTPAAHLSPSRALDNKSLLLLLALGNFDRLKIYVFLDAFGKEFIDNFLRICQRCLQEMVFCHAGLNARNE